MKVCPECKGRMRKEHTSVTLFREETPVLFENVPAWVCMQCGETWLSANAARKLDEQLMSELEPRRYISMPVIAFAATS